MTALAAKAALIDAMPRCFQKMHQMSSACRVGS